MVFFTTKFKSFSQAATTAPQELADHTARSKQLYDAGTLLMAGAFIMDKPQKPLSTMAVLVSRGDAEDYIKNDPFVLSGMVSDWYIREWANMLA